jgi:hypothetical protein
VLGVFAGILFLDMGRVLVLAFREFWPPTLRDDFWFHFVGTWIFAAVIAGTALWSALTLWRKPIQTSAPPVIAELTRAPVGSQPFHAAPTEIRVVAGSRR